MTKEIILTISGAHQYSNSGDDQMNLVTEGVMRELGDALELEYEESELTDMEGTVTNIIIQGPQVSLMRTGEVCSQMVFEQGRRHLSVYSTPYGTLEIAVATQRLENHLTLQGGTLEIDYSLEMDHALVGFVAFRLSVRVKE
jgi:uncharacterized beta-barrel protein YwiB (DUF1934 family)